jgi:GntR family transcriptional regulator
VRDSRRSADKRRPAGRVAGNGRLRDRTTLPGAQQPITTRIYSSTYVGRQLETIRFVYVTDDRIDPIAPLPPYRQIADILRRRIESGRYQPDTRIPTESELIEAFEVARTTARRAIAVLRDEGLIYTVPQRGSYVARRSSASKR